MIITESIRKGQDGKISEKFLFTWTLKNLQNIIKLVYTQSYTFLDIYELHTVNTRYPDFKGYCKNSY